MSVDDVGVTACLDDLRELGARLLDRVRRAGSGASEADVAVKLFGTISAAYLTHVWAEPDHPVFLPSVGYYQMYGSPSPDTIYRNAAIDGTGVYRVTGHRGSVPDVTIMPFGAPTAAGLRIFPPFDLVDLALEDDGTFDVVLSRNRPEGVRNWWPLDPQMRTLMLRSVSTDWGEHDEPRVAIVRLDTDPRRARTRADALRTKFRSYATVVEGMVMSGLRRVADLRAADVVNRLTTVDYSAQGGLDDQWYQEGCFELGADEALVAEAALPRGWRGFSLSLTDACFSTIDWANAHSSLNQRQAVVDDDGVLRVVVAATDPGARNWLDTTGHRSGVLQCRWSGGACPEVTVRVVDAAALDGVLPAATARVTPQQRAAEVRARQIGAQLRSRW